MRPIIPGIIIVLISMVVAMFLQNGFVLLDIIFSASVLAVLFLIQKPLGIRDRTIFAALIPILLHIIGGFHLYRLEGAIIGYDTLVHLVSGAILALIIHDIIKVAQQKMHTAMYCIIIITAAAGLGVVVEIIEFFAYFVIPQTQQNIGILAVTVDNSNYVDTITDLIVNLIGSTLAAVFLVKKQ